MNDASRLLEITPRAGTLQIDNWAEWWSAFAQRTTWLDALALALGALLAWLLVRWLGAWAARVAGQLRAARNEADGAGSGAAGQSRLSVLFGTRQVDGALFPLFWLGLTYLERMALLHWVGHAPLLRLALPALTALLLIRSVATVLRAALPGVAAVRLLERTVSWAAWMGMLLWVSGVLPAVMRQLDTITWKMGGTQMSVTDLIEGALTAGALMLLALWASSYLEERLLRRATGATLSVRKAVAKATRAFMLFLGLMLGLSAVGIDLTALSVLGGAMGVGIGFGLQKLAASYISGFLVLAERSLRIGDLVRVGGFEGSIADIRTRYTVIRATNGSEALVPNETLMTSTVENLSFSDSRLNQSTTITVGYDSDAAQVQRLLEQAALQCSRVLRQPAPAALLNNFGADGLEFTLSYWLGDPENGGLGGVRSQVNLAILDALRGAGVDIPYPQRVLHINPPGSASAAVAGAGAKQAPGAGPQTIHEGGQGTAASAESGMR